MIGFYKPQLNDDDADKTNTGIVINDNDDAKWLFNFQWLQWWWQCQKTKNSNTNYNDEKIIFFHNDYNDNDEILKPKASMMVTITRHILKIGRWQVDDNDEYHKNHRVSPLIEYHRWSHAHLCLRVLLFMNNLKLDWKYEFK